VRDLPPGPLPLHFFHAPPLFGKVVLADSSDYLHSIPNDRTQKGDLFGTASLMLFGEFVGVSAWTPSYDSMISSSLSPSPGVSPFFILDPSLKRQPLARADELSPAPSGFPILN